MALGAPAQKRSGVLRLPQPGDAGYGASANPVRRIHGTAPKPAAAADDGMLRNTVSSTVTGEEFDADLQEDRESVCGPITLNGLPASVTGYMNKMATVTDRKTGLRCEWSWHAIALVRSRGHELKATNGRKSRKPVGPDRVYEEKFETADERSALCAGPAIMNGRSAIISGSGMEYARVTDEDSGLYAEWSWPQVARIRAHGSEFTS